MEIQGISKEVLDEYFMLRLNKFIHEDPDGLSDIINNQLDDRYKMPRSLQEALRRNLKIIGRARALEDGMENKRRLPGATDR